jgi:phage gp36-like protein
MSYASVDDMVQRFGAAEMIRASTPDGQPAVAVVAAPIQAALDSASAIIDGYLRGRYDVPLDVAPAEVNRACCMLARYDMMLGGERAPSEQAKVTRDETVSWLRHVAEGKVLLDIAQVAPGDQSYAAYSTRPQVFGDQGFTDCGFGGGGFWGNTL